MIKRLCYISSGDLDHYTTDATDNIIQYYIIILYYYYYNNTISTGCVTQLPPPPLLYDQQLFTLIMHELGSNCIVMLQHLANKC